MSYSPTAQDVPVHVFGGPTTLIEYGGLRLLTDPTFDDPGEYQFTEDFFLVKTAPPSTPPPTSVELTPSYCPTTSTKTIWIPPAGNFSPKFHASSQRKEAPTVLAVIRTVYNRGKRQS